MEAIYNTVLKLAETGRPAVLGTIIRQEGPTPRELGTQCVILEGGTMVGTIGGGLLEAQAIEASREVFDTRLPKRLYFSLTGKDVAETGMLCGGRVEVFLEPLLLDSKETVALFRGVQQTLKQGEWGLMATLIDPEAWTHAVPPKRFFAAKGEPYGNLPGGQGITDTLEAQMNTFIHSRRTALLTLENDEGKPLQILVEPITAPATLLVFGAGHVSRQIVPLAHRVEFHVTVIDDRDAFADETYFPGADSVLCRPFKDIMEELNIDEFSYLVIVTRGHIHDKMVLAQALKTTARYIGMIGSRRKRDIIYEKLLEEGFNKEDLDRVYSPVGIDIGAQTPEEIAVSIVAQLIQVRAGGVKWPFENTKHGKGE